jgi:hypothetical protein
MVRSRGWLVSPLRNPGITVIDFGQVHFIASQGVHAAQFASAGISFW